MKRLLLLILSLLFLSFPIFAEDPQGDTSMPADMSADFPGMDQMPADGATPQANVTAPADPSSDFPGMEQMPADGTAPQSNVTAPADASSDFPGMDEVNSGVQIDPAVETNAVPEAKAPKKRTTQVKAGLPKYKAVPYTNDLRIMDKKTGALGQVESLQRLMDWGIEASTSMERKKHFASDTKDLNAYTAWVENKDGYGEGESLTLYMDPIYFSALQEGEVGSVTCTGLKIINGYNKSHDDWFNNSRVKIMKIYQNKKPFCLIELYDSTNWQDIYFKKPMKIRPDDVIKAEIVETFEGYKYPNAAITEFLLVGNAGGQIIGYDQMNGQSKTNVRNGGVYYK